MHKIKQIRLSAVRVASRPRTTFPAVRHGRTPFPAYAGHSEAGHSGADLVSAYAALRADSRIQDIELIEPLKIDEEFNKDDKDENFNLEEISINGYVEIINGDIEIKANNKLVQNMLAWYANMTSMNYVYNTVPSGSSWLIGTYNWNMYLGTDQITTTDYNRTVLVSPIGSTPGTAPNTLSGVTTNPSNGVFNIIFTGTWVAGTISGTIGEMALYLNIISSLQSFGWTKNFGTGATETSQLVSRLAVADGAFSPFAINTANPLTINWTYRLSFS